MFRCYKGTNCFKEENNNIKDHRRCFKLEKDGKSLTIYLGSSLKNLPEDVFEQLFDLHLFDIGSKFRKELDNNSVKIVKILEKRLKEALMTLRVTHENENMLVATDSSFMHK
jgi:hypothetical protein